MAIFHLRMRVVGRSSGQSAVASAAYRSGDKLHDERYEKTHDYSRKEGIHHSEILLPEGAPERFADRATLWNEVEQKETRVNSQLAREFNVALPVELDTESQVQLLRGYVQAEFVGQGMCADISWHDLASHNPHGHVMLTMRECNGDGFTVKNREWNKTDMLEGWREAWQVHANAALEEYGDGARIDHRTLEAQGIDRAPGIHLPVAAWLVHQSGGETYFADRQAEITRDNAYKTGYAALTASGDDSELEEIIYWQRELEHDHDTGDDWADWRDYAAQRDYSAWQQRTRDPDQEENGLSR